MRRRVGIAHVCPLRPPPLSLLDLYRGADVLPLYTGRVRVTGGEAAHGRASGVIRSIQATFSPNALAPQTSHGLDETNSASSGATPSMISTSR